MIIPYIPLDCAYYFIGLIAALPPILWIFYVTVMQIKNLRDDGKLTPLLLVIGTCVLFVGYIIDALCNFLTATILFLDLPKELTVTARMHRYVYGPDGWRRTLAYWVVVVLLNPFSRDPHITLPINRPAPAGFFTSGV